MPRKKDIKKRQRRSPAEKDSIVRHALRLWAEKPTLGMLEVAEAVGLDSTSLRKTLDRYGTAYGWEGSLPSLRDALLATDERQALLERVRTSVLPPEEEEGDAEEQGEPDEADEAEGEAPPATAASSEPAPSEGAGEPNASWLAKHGAQLRLAMGVTDEPKEKEPEPARIETTRIGTRAYHRRTMLSRPEPDAAEQAAQEPEPEVAIQRQPLRDYPPRRVFLERPERQEEMDPEAFKERALMEALRERDALAIAMRVLLRDEARHGR